MFDEEKRSGKDRRRAEIFKNIEDKSKQEAKSTHNNEGNSTTANNVFTIGNMNGNISNNNTETTNIFFCMIQPLDIEQAFQMFKEWKKRKQKLNNKLPGNSAKKIT